MTEAAAVEFDLDRAIVELISRESFKVPPYPAVALRIEGMVRSKEYGLDQLAETIGSDPALAADILRCANSVFYSRGAPVTSIKHAVTRIGGKEVLRLAIATGLGIHARSAGPLIPLKRQIWHESLASGMICQFLADRRALPAEEAFVCGLLHDFGKLVAAACIEEILGQHPEAGAKPIEFWGAVADRYHQELGLVTAARWHLPSLVADVISLHHSKDFSKSETPDLLEVVAASDLVVALLDQKPQVTEEDLVGIAALRRPDERAAVARVLQTIPAYIAALEGPDTKSVAAVSFSKILGPNSILGDPQKQLTFPVKMSVGVEQIEGQAMGIGAGGIALATPKAVPLNQLIEINALTEPKAFSFWGAAKVCVAEGSGFRIEVKPLALSTDNRARWQELLK